QSLLTSAATKFMVRGRCGRGPRALRFMGSPLSLLRTHRDHEPWRSGVSAERRNYWEQQQAALCRDEATEKRLLEWEHLQKFDARAFLAVVEDDLHPSTGKFRVDFFSQSHHWTVGRHGQRRKANRVRRNRRGPDNAVLVVALLDDGLKRARHADAVAAHDGRL